MLHVQDKPPVITLSWIQQQLSRPDTISLQNSFKTNLNINRRSTVQLVTLYSLVNSSMVHGKIKTSTTSMAKGRIEGGETKNIEK